MHRDFYTSFKYYGALNHCLHFIEEIQKWNFIQIFFQKIHLCINYYISHNLEEPQFILKNMYQIICERGGKIDPHRPSAQPSLFPSMGKINFPGLCLLEVPIHDFVSLGYSQDMSRGELSDETSVTGQTAEPDVLLGDGFRSHRPGSAAGPPPPAKPAQQRRAPACRSSHGGCAGLCGMASVQDRLATRLPHPQSSLSEPYS